MSTANTCGNKLKSEILGCKNSQVGHISRRDKVRWFYPGDILHVAPLLLLPIIHIFKLWMFGIEKFHTFSKLMII